MQHPHSDLSTVETADVAHVEREPKRRQRKQVVPIQAIPPARKVKNAVKPVANAIRILKFLAQTGKPTTVTQIAREFAINTSTCFNILRTLVGEDMIDFSELSKTYTVGLGTVKLVEKTLSDGERMAAAMPHLAEIADHFAVNVTVWKRMAMERIILVATQETSRYPRIHMKPGQRLPLLMGASRPLRIFAGRGALLRSKPIGARCKLQPREAGLATMATSQPELLRLPHPFSTPTEWLLLPSLH
jgi:DNA-binding MarR family transcriptional regulator